jgi:hypothetical protein
MAEIFSIEFDSGAPYCLKEGRRPRDAMEAVTGAERDHGAPVHSTRHAGGPGMPVSG